LALNINQNTTTVCTESDDENKVTLSKEKVTEEGFSVSLAKGNEYWSFP